jgi:hypothetical protein
MAQHLDLERKVDCLIAKCPVFGFQSLEKAPILTPFPGPAGLRKLENGNVFLAVR